MMDNRRTPKFNTPLVLLVSGLLLYAFLFLAHPISLSNSELGLFLKKGEQLVETGNWVRTNHFTYPNADYPVSIQTWGAELGFYGLFRSFGFSGLHFFCILLLSLPLFSLIFLLIKEGVPKILIGILGTVMIPLIIWNFRVDPLLFTTFFSVFFFALIYQYLSNRISLKILYILPVLQMIWANTGYYFLLGIFILAIGIQSKLLYTDQFKRNDRKNLFGVLVVCILATCIHPDWHLNLFNELQKTVEFLFIKKEISSNLISRYWNTKAAIWLHQIMMMITFFISSWFNRKNLKDERYLFLFGIGVLMTLFTMFSFTGNLATIILFPIISINLYTWWVDTDNNIQVLLSWKSPLVLVYCIVPFFLIGQFYNPLKSNFKIGIHKNSAAAANFIKKTGIEGLFFHNKRAAGYLAYYLSPKEKQFILPDNNSSPKSFRQQHYFPAIRNTDNWNSTSLLYNFNVIYFQLDGESIKNLKFLGDRLVEQSTWALVYHQPEQNAILLKRTDRNKEIIAKYEIQFDQPEN